MKDNFLKSLHPALKDGRVLPFLGKEPVNGK